MSKFARKSFVRNATGIAVGLRLDGSISEALRVEARVNACIAAAPPDERDDLEETAGDAEESAMFSYRRHYE